MLKQSAKYSIYVIHQDPEANLSLSGFVGKDVRNKENEREGKGRQ